MKRREGPRVMKKMKTTKTMMMRLMMARMRRRRLRRSERCESIFVRCSIIVQILQDRNKRIINVASHISST